MGNAINNLLDNLLSVLWRVLDLPLYSIVLGMAIGMFILYLITKKILKRNPTKILIVLAVILVVLVIDKKLNNMRTELTFMNNKIAEAKMSSSAVEVTKIKKFDVEKLRQQFPEAIVYDKTINEAIDLVSYKTSTPNVMAYISIIDLDYPNIKVKVTPEKKEKYLTSTFAKEHNCIVAINGEAGLSMAMDCELGEWSGNWISDGKIVMMADTDLRPFIGFDRRSKAFYSTDAEVDTIYDPNNKYNAIWGRFDILVQNELILHENDNPYARTIMGTNKEGNLLYLMIVDGKRPDYSEGLTYENCAKILQALGAYNAMACDQGGSSCMYMEPMGGIINRPADSDGYERPIYSHFGIAM